MTMYKIVRKYSKYYAVLEKNRNAVSKYSYVCTCGGKKGGKKGDFKERESNLFPIQSQKLDKQTKVK